MLEAIIIDADTVMPRWIGVIVLLIVLFSVCVRLLGWHPRHVLGGTWIWVRRTWHQTQVGEPRVAQPALMGIAIGAALVSGLCFAFAIAFLFVSGGATLSILAALGCLGFGSLFGRAAHLLHRASLAQPSILQGSNSGEASRES